MLALLLEQPRTPAEWSRWSFHHRDHHQVILQAATAKGAKGLQQYVLDPISFTAWDEWLARNQQMHTDIDTFLGTQASDLERVDYRDPREMQAWIYNHYQEHYAWTQALKVE